MRNDDSRIKKDVGSRMEKDEGFRMEKDEGSRLGMMRVLEWIMIRVL